MMCKGIAHRGDLFGLCPECEVRVTFRALARNLALRFHLRHQVHGFGCSERPTWQRQRCVNENRLDSNQGQ